MRSADGRREPHLLLRAAAQHKSYAATVGCNRMGGSYATDGTAISFTPAAATLLPCPAPLDALEKKLGETLDSARQWQITGNTLERADGKGTAVALLEAVYM